MKNKGQAIAEFAILVPVLLLFILGIFQIGYLGLTYVVVNHASFQVARVTSVNEGAVNDAARSAIPFRSGEVRVELNHPGGTDDIEVTVIYNLPLYFPIINEVLRSYFNLSGYSFPVSATCLTKREPV